MSTRALAIVALAGLALALLGCSPNPPTEGLFGCATGGCPASFPYCHDDDHLCWSTPEEDAGPRPDAYIPPGTDAFVVGGSVPEFGRCSSAGQCASGLSCISGFCGRPCAMGGAMCEVGRACAPMVTDASGMFACLVDCIPAGVVCPSGTMRREITMGGGMRICHCAP